MRWIGTYVAASEPKFVHYEKMFLGFAWIPKATVQAAIGGTTLANALAMTNVRPETQLYWIAAGKVLLSMAVIAVIITAPLGAILTNTLGVRWLNHDEDYDASSPNGDMEMKANTAVVTSSDIPVMRLQSLGSNENTAKGLKEGDPTPLEIKQAQVSKVIMP